MEQPLPPPTTSVQQLPLIFFLYSALDATMAHPGCGSSPSYPRIPSSVLSVHPPKCIFPHSQGIGRAAPCRTLRSHARHLRLHAYRCSCEAQDYLSLTKHNAVCNPSPAACFSTTGKISCRILLRNGAEQLAQLSSRSCLSEFSALLKRIFPHYLLSQPPLQVAWTILNSIAILSFTSIQLPVDHKFDACTSLLPRLLIKREEK